MLFHLEQRPYVVEEHRFLDGNISGLQVARQPFAEANVTPSLTAGPYWQTASHGEIDFYGLLQDWIRPVLVMENISIETVFTDPESVPYAIRTAPLNTRSSLVVNCFPGKKWSFTTRGLADMGLLEHYRVDRYTDVNNHRSCVPVAFGEMGLIPADYYHHWVAAIAAQPRDPTTTFEYSSHMIEVRADSDDWFRIGDQYGVGFVRQDTLVHMAKARRSFGEEGGAEYYVQYFAPQNSS